MRTLLLAVVMMLVAVAAGLSFVLQAAAQERPSAEMEFGCGPGPVLASGEPTLVTCRAMARNTSTVPLSGAQLEFVNASTLPPPDF